MPIINYPIRLRAISMFLERAFKVNDEYVQILDKEYTEEEWDDFGEAEHDGAFVALLDYQEIVTRAAVLELNALVENEIRWTAKSIRRKYQEMSVEEEKKISRREARKIVENEFRINFDDIPGFSEVEEIRRISNAYKHDDGYSSKYEPFFIGFVEKKYELNTEVAEKYLSAVSKFLRALPGKRLYLGEDVRTKM